MPPVVRHRPSVPCTDRVRATHATDQVVGGEAILIHLNSGQYYSLNQTGTWLWEHLDGQTALEQWGTALAAACNILDSRWSLVGNAGVNKRVNFNESVFNNRQVSLFGGASYRLDRQEFTAAWVCFAAAALVGLVLVATSSRLPLRMEVKSNHFPSGE